MYVRHYMWSATFGTPVREIVDRGAMWRKDALPSTCGALAAVGCRGELGVPQTGCGQGKRGMGVTWTMAGVGCAAASYPHS